MEDTMAEGHLNVAHVTSRAGPSNFQVDIRAGRHALSADEPPALGGADGGPSPFQLLLSSLAACTTITLRMYGQRKGWPLAGVDVDLRYTKDGDADHIDRRLLLHGDLTPEQRARLAEIAEKTPVTLALRGGVSIATTLAGDPT
jgi:putative redox protein